MSSRRAFGCLPRRSIWPPAISARRVISAISDAPCALVRAAPECYRRYDRRGCTIPHGADCREVIVVDGTVHQIFTDAQSYFSASGRSLLGAGTSAEAIDDIIWRTSDIITAFVGSYLDIPRGPTLEQVVASHPSVRQERHVAMTRT